MKKFLAVIVAMAGVIVLASTAKAALTGSVVLSVTPTGTKSILLDKAAMNLGSVAYGLTGISGSSVTVTNDGPIPETFGLRITAEAGDWANQPGSATLAVDQYNLRALFNGVTVPVKTDFGAAVTTNDVRTGAVVLAAVGGAYAGTENGVGVIPAAHRGLWFRMDLPPTTAHVPAVQNVTVEVSAN